MLTYDRVIIHLERGLLLTAALALLLGACAPSPGNQAAAPLAGTAEEASPPTPPPTKASPTEIPTEPPTPTPELGPEEPAISIDQVAGKWLMKFLGGGAGDTGIFSLSPDGTYSMDAISGEHEGMNLGTGTFRFEADVMLLESKYCLRLGPTDVFFACTARYNAFVSMNEGQPARLRLVAIEDVFTDRKKSLDGKTFLPYSEP